MADQSRLIGQPNEQNSGPRHCFRDNFPFQVYRPCQCGSRPGSAFGPGFKSDPLAQASTPVQRSYFEREREHEHEHFPASIH